MGETAEPPPWESWQQGDFSIGKFELPALAMQDGKKAIRVAPCDGLIIISQTCDLIKPSADREFLQVAPLLPPPVGMKEIERGYRPRYVTTPTLANFGFVADLDVVATVSKEFARDWTIVRGCVDTEQQRNFSQALARHKRRFAFPDELQAALGPMRKWVISCRRGSGAEVDMIQALDQIRLAADWERPGPIEVNLIFEVEPTPEQSLAWEAPQEKLLAFIAAKYPGSTLSVHTWRDFSAEQLRTSDRLDFDGLSDA